MRVIEITEGDLGRFHQTPFQHVFSSNTWCSCYDHRLKYFLIEDQPGQAIAKFVAFQGGKFGMKTLITPPFAPSIGLACAEGKNNPVKQNTFKKQIIEAIAHFLKHSKYAYFKLDFDPEWQDMQPLQWRGIHTQVRYTYRLDLSVSEESLLSNMDSNKRNKLNKAEREGLTHSNLAQREVVFNLIRNGLRDKPVALHPVILNRILHVLQQESIGIWSIAMQQEKAVAATVCITSDDCAYNLFSAVDRNTGMRHSGTFALFNAIRSAQLKRISTFDFEGSSVPAIEEYFRSFGGTITPYFSVQGGSWPMLQLMKWKQKKGLPKQTSKFFKKA